MSRAKGFSHAAKTARKLQRTWKRPKLMPHVAKETNVPILPDFDLAIATIKASLGLSITDLSTCLATSRQTIYTWIRKKNTPHQENIERLTSLYQVAERWQLLSPLPAKEFYTKIGELLMPGFDVDKVVEALGDALHSPKTQPRQKSNFEQLLEKHGIDINTLPSQDEQFDLMTGKSNFFGEFDEPEE